ncbi:MAG: hypothetical protein ACTSRW_12375 [Candidatus Helarchaeota archaeon]
MVTNVNWKDSRYLGFLFILFSVCLFIQFFQGVNVELFFPIFVYQIVLIPFGTSLVICCSVVLLTEILLNINKKIIRSKKFKREFRSWSPFWCFVIAIIINLMLYLAIYMISFIIFWDPLILPIWPFYFKYILAQVLGCLPTLLILFAVEEYVFPPS